MGFASSSASAKVVAPASPSPSSAFSLDSPASSPSPNSSPSASATLKRNIAAVSSLPLISDICSLMYAIMVPSTSCSMSRISLSRTVKRSPDSSKASVSRASSSAISLSTWPRSTRSTTGRSLPRNSMSSRTLARPPSRISQMSSPKMPLTPVMMSPTSRPASIAFSPALVTTTVGTRAASDSKARIPNGRMISTLSTSSASGILAQGSPSSP
mmetsp:Transcript_34764/g.109155  ORF Transcript_34764/g.109155 Transcript_34764/m.109155 type:complete len:213 (-) Transcript_34764:79-717(-)